jgi:hypothetical protein
MVEVLVPEPSFCDVEIATEKLKRYKSKGSDQITAELKQYTYYCVLRSKDLLIPFGVR